jgi:hypothetical protein
MITKQTGGVRQRIPVVERRLNHKLRDRFDTALQLLRPILERSLANDTMMYLVMQRLHTAYPDLSAHEIEALVVSVMRSLKKKDEALRLVISNS